MDEISLLTQKLNRLKLIGFADTLPDRLRQATEEKWSYTRLLTMLFADEVDRRDAWVLSRRLSVSGLDGNKTFETFDFSFNPKVNVVVFRELATCRYFDKKENIFLVGPSGAGKSHLAQALGHEACRKGFGTYFDRTLILLQWINSGRGDGSYNKRMSFVQKIPLLILDDFGLQPLAENLQNDFYEIIDGRHEKTSTIITSNRDVDEWLSVFSNPLLGGAAVDRLMHHAIKITFDDKNYRLSEYIKRNKSEKNLDGGKGI